MKVAITYAEAKRQVVIEIDVADGTSIEQAIQSSGILGKFPEIDFTKNKVGIFGKLAPLEQLLSQGDRIEIYRPALGKPPKKSRADNEGKGDTDQPKKATAAKNTSPTESKPASEDAPVSEEDAAAAKAAKMAATKARIAAAKAKMQEKKTAAAS